MVNFEQSIFLNFSKTNNTTEQEEMIITHDIFDFEEYILVEYASPYEHLYYFVLINMKHPVQHPTNFFTKEILLICGLGWAQRGKLLRVCFRVG